MSFTDGKIKIVPFKEGYASEFKRLNLEWLEFYNLLEPEDLKYIENPQQFIIGHGGRILIAIADDVVVGTCAIIKVVNNTAELAKLAVSPDTRGKGIGRKLTIESIKQAEQMGFKKIILVSNKKLATAVRLYESLGFIHKPIPEDIVYVTADVYMELKIG